MPKHRTVQTVVESSDWDPEDPRIAGKDPSMTPGHPQCNYAKYLEAQPKVDIVMTGDYENRQYKTFRLRFNTYTSPEYPYGQTVYVARPLAVNALLTGRATTSDRELMRELDGQIRPPIEGPLPGPFSGEYADQF